MSGTHEFAAEVNDGPQARSQHSDGVYIFSYQILTYRPLKLVEYSTLNAYNNVSLFSFPTAVREQGNSVQKTKKCR